jgi:hypothetical protein
MYYGTPLTIFLVNIQNAQKARKHLAGRSSVRTTNHYFVTYECR